jgi:hypothetical protein
MSPNGRRRFRRMNRRFRQRGPSTVRERALNTNGGMARKMILVQWWGGDPLPLPPKPFTPRSLVGMTQGARKRSARLVASKSISEDQAVAYINEYGSFLRSAEYLGAYWDSRSKYRIGQKLRPCSGCVQCFVCVSCENDTCARTSHRASLCDGSGVLPARKENQ